MIADERKTGRQDEEAAAWFTLLSDTTVENEDLEKFEGWLQRGGSRAAYRRFEDISSLGRSLRDDPQMRAAAREALDRPRRASSKPRRLKRAWLPIGGGMALAGALACAATVWLVPVPKTYQTDVGGRTSVQLDDGSTVQLNTDTLVRVKFSGRERRIELVRGQAYFDVAHETARPFLVKAGAMEVRAVGTRFDVRSDPSRASVALAQGRVQVRQDDGARASWTLAPGQALVLAPGASNAGPIPADIAEVTGWMRNEITFHDVPLSEAVAEMNRYSRAKITLAAGAPAKARISGVFTPGDQEAFVAAVTSSFGLESRRAPDGGAELGAAKRGG